MKAYKETVRKYYKYKESEWIQPTLTVNGSLGGSSFAVGSTCEINASTAWKAFDGSTSTYGYCYFNAPNNNKSDYILYNPIGLNITELTLNIYIVTQITVSYSDDGKTFTQCGYLSRGSTWGQGTVVVNVDTGNTYHKYYKIYFNNTAGVSQPQIYDIKIKATQKIIDNGTVSDYDFYEDVEVYKLPAKVDRTYYKLFYMCEVAGTFTSSGWQKTDKGTHYIHGEANAYEIRNNPTVTSTYTWNTPIPARTYVYNLNVTGQGNGYYNNPTVTITYENGNTEVVFKVNSSINNYNSNFSFEAKYPVKSISIQGTLTYTSINYVFVYMSLASQSFISTKDSYDYYEDKTTYYGIGG